MSGRILQDDNDSDFPLSSSLVPSSELSDETVSVDRNEEENDELQQSHEEKKRRKIPQQLIVENANDQVGETFLSKQWKESSKRT